MYPDYVSTALIARDVLQDLQDGEYGPTAQRRIEALARRALETDGG